MALTYTWIIKGERFGGSYNVDILKITHDGSTTDVDTGLNKTLKGVMVMDTTETTDRATPIIRVGSTAGHLTLTHGMTNGATTTLMIFS